MPEVQTREDGTFFVEHDGTEIDVEPSEGNVRVVSEDGYQSSLRKVANEKEAAARRRADQEIEKKTRGRYTPSELLEEENADTLAEFIDLGRDRLSEVLGVDKNKDIDAVRTATLETVRKKEVAPLREEIADRDKTIAGLTEGLLENDALKAGAAHHVKERLRPFLSDRYRRLAKYSPEHGKWFIKSSDGRTDFELSENVEGGEQYMTISEHLGIMRKKGDWADLFEPKARDGVGGDDDVGGDDERDRTGDRALANVKKKSDLKTDKEKVRYIRKMGRDKWESLPA